MNEPMPAKSSLMRETVTLNGLTHIEVVKLCSNSPTHPAWQEFYQRFDRYIKIYIKKAWKRHAWLREADGTAQETLADLIQEVYLKLLEDDQQALRKFKGTAANSFFAYLSRIAMNIVAEHFRRQQADKRKGQMVSTEQLLDESDAHRAGAWLLTYNYLSTNCEPGLLASITISQLSQLLDEVLMGANQERDKRIFKLHVVDGYSPQQIAAIEDFGLKVSSIESTIRRTRAKLCSAFNSYINRLLANNSDNFGQSGCEEREGKQLPAHVGHPSSF
ncbi:MAG: sigma-70 family RNA polymerase sigma factor [Acidobacteriota bacterium]